MLQVRSSQTVARRVVHADIGPAGRFHEPRDLIDSRHIGAGRREGDRSGGMADHNAGRPQALLTNGLRHRDVLQLDVSVQGQRSDQVSLPG